MTESQARHHSGQEYCSECDSPLETSDAHVCKACIDADDFDRYMAQFESDVDAYVDWRFEPCGY